MPCARCGAEASPGRFCNACGAALVVSCPQCQADNPPGSAFCNGCGRALSDGAANTSAPVNPAAAQPQMVAVPAVLVPAVTMAPYSPPYVSPALAQQVALTQEPYDAPRAGFGSAIAAYFRGYVVWNARSTRAEYWWVALFTVFVSVPLAVIDLVATFGVLSALWLLVTFLPSLSLLIRRLHDTGRSGAWYWFSLIPFVGPFFVLIPVMFFRSLPHATRWNRSLIKEIQGTAPQALSAGPTA